MRKKYSSTFRILLSFFAIILLLTCVLSCNRNTSKETESANNNEKETIEIETTKPEIGIIPTWTNTASNGLCLVLPGAKQDTNIMIDLTSILGANAVRLWMHATSLLNDPSTPNEAQTIKNKAWIQSLKDAGITKIVGMSHYWFQPSSIDISKMDSHLAHTAVIYRDYSNPLYMEFLNIYEETWYTMAKTYPEIEIWEVGNEMNFDSFLHPFSYATNKTPFTQDEKAEIVTDMLYYASRGIHRANKNAIVLFPGMAPVDGFDCMATFLERVYKCIKSGKYGNGCTDTYCYFQAVAWHAYFLKSTYTLKGWLDGNRKVYSIMEKYGDENKKVLITEFGFSDGGSKENDVKEAQYFTEILSHLSDLPFVDSVYPFRLMEYRSSSNLDPVEIYYGIMRGFDKTHIGAKEKAKAICNAYGGDISSLDKYIGDNTVYAN